MEKLQEKSPCCRGKTWVLNKKRRQCSLCKKTWRCWPKRRGRKKNRISNKLLIKYLNNELGIVSKQKNAKGLSSSAFQERMRKSLVNYNDKTPWPDIPTGDLIVIADAMVEYIEHIPHIIYFMFLRSIHANQAVILPASFAVNTGEGYYGWNKAFDLIPDEAKKRIRALVCDGAQSFIRIARENKWVLQRCHFHLLARLKHNSSLGRFGKNRKQAKRILDLAGIILSTNDKEKIIVALEEIMEIRKSVTSKAFRTTLRGFSKHYEDFRAYIKYPEYNLPTTSNTAEVFIGRIRNLQYRAHGFRTLKSLLLWIEAYSKFRDIGKKRLLL